MNYNLRVQVEVVMCLGRGNPDFSLNIAKENLIATAEVVK